MIKYSDLRKQIGKSLQKQHKAAGSKSTEAFASYMRINSNTHTDYEQGKAVSPTSRRGSSPTRPAACWTRWEDTTSPARRSAPTRRPVSTFRSVTSHGKKTMPSNAKDMGEEYLSKSDSPEMAASLTTRAASWRP